MIIRQYTEILGTRIEEFEVPDGQTREELVAQAEAGQFKGKVVDDQFTDRLIVDRFVYVVGDDGLDAEPPLYEEETP